MNNLLATSKATGRASGETPRLLSHFEAARLLNVKSQTLANWRSSRRVQIPYFKVGRAIRYAESDLLAFLDAQRRVS
jgi:hypothetical protein